MISEPLAPIAVCIVLYGAFSNVLGRIGISAPMAFMIAGLLVGAGGLGLVDIDVENETLEGFGELTLAFILFADAASTNGRKLLKDSALPFRLLTLSLPLTLLLGFGVAIVLFPTLSWQECALIAAILAPTDAALGYAVVTSPNVPERIRRAVLVESGLNDGLALPAVLLFSALAYNMEGGENSGFAYWAQFTLTQIVIGALVGVGVGAVFGKLISIAQRNGWITHSFRNLTCGGVAVLVLFCAHALNGNGFIAAFVCGLIFGDFCRDQTRTLTNFVEEEGQLFSLLIFFFFGAVLLPSATDFLTVFCIAYAALSLTMIRMIPTSLSLIGSKVSLPGQAFIGWFGPRGLASILFLFVAVEHQEGARLSQVEAIVYVTVFLSVFLHGATATLFSDAYGRSAAARRDAQAKP